MRIQNVMATTVKIDTVSATSSMKSLNLSIRASTNAWKAEEAQAKSVGNYLQAAKSRYEGLGTSIDRAREKIKILTERQKELDTSTDKGKDAYNRYSNQIAKTITQLGSMEAQQKRAGESVKYQTSGLADLQSRYKSLNEVSASYIKRLEAEGKDYAASVAKINSYKTSVKGLTEQQKIQEQELKRIASESGVTSKEYQTQKIRVNETAASIGKYNSKIKAAESDTRKYTSGLASLQSKYKSTNSAAKSYAERLSAEGKKYESARVKLNNYKSSIENLTKQQKIQEQELKRIASESGKTSSAYKSQQVKVNETATSITKLNSKVLSAQKEVDKLKPTGFNRLANGAKKVTTASSKMKSTLHGVWEHAKAGAGAAAAGIGAVGAAAIAGAKKSANLEQSYKEITNLAVLGGEKQKEAVKNVAEMEKQGRDMSIQYGKSQQSIAEAYEDLIKRGYNTQQALGAMRTELQGSVASGDDFADVVKVSSTTLESFGMRAKTTKEMTANTKRAVNELAYAADATSTGFKELGYGMEYVGSTAHQSGISLSETASAMGILSNNGLEASKAGTGLNQVINRLSDAAGKLSKGDKKNVLAQMGISPKEIMTSSGKLKSLSTVFGVLNKHMKGMSKVQKVNLMKSLFGVTGEQAGLILAKYNGELDDLTKKTRNMGKNGTYVADLAKKNSQTAKMQMARLKMAGEAFTMTLGKKMLPAINEAGNELVVFLTKNKDGKKLMNDFANSVGNVANTIVSLIKWSASHKTEVKWIFGGFLGAGLLVKGAKFVQFLNNTRLALKGFKEARTAAKALKETEKAAKGISKTSKIFGAMRSGASKAGTAISKHLTNVWDKTLIRWSNAKTKIGKFFTSIPGKAKTAAAKTQKVLSKLAENSRKAFSKSVSFTKGLFGKGEGAGKLTGLMQSAHSAGGFKNLTTAGKVGTVAAGAGVAVDTATSIVKAIKDKAGSRKQYEDIGTAAGKGVGGAIGLYFGGPAGAAIGAKIGGAVGKWGGDAAKNFQNGWNKKKPPKKFWSLENLGWSTHDTFKKIGKWGSDVGKKFSQGVKSTKSFVKKNSKELALTATNPLVGIPKLLYKNNPKFRKWANGVGKNINKGFKSVKKNVGNFNKAVGKNVSNFTKSANKKYKQFTNSVGKSVKKGFDGAKKNVSKFNKAVGKNVSNFTKAANKKYKQFTNSVNKTFKKHWNNLYKHSSKGTKQIMRSTEKLAKNYVKTNKKANTETIKNFGSFSSRLKKNHGNLFKTIGQTAKTQLGIEKRRWSSNWKNIKTTANGIWKGLNSNASDMYKKLNTASHGGLDKVLSKFKGFGKNISEFWSGLWKGITKTFDDTVKGIKDGLGNVGKFFTGKLKVGNLHLASGTDWHKRYGYPAILNDGSDSPETGNRESLIHTDGSIELLQGRNIKRWIMPGQEVINARDTAKLFGTTHLASGTVSGLFHDHKATKLLRKIAETNSKSYKLRKKRYDEDTKRHNDDKKRHDKNELRREKKDSQQPRKIIGPKRARSGMEYVDSSFFTGSKHETGKIVEVSKTWMKKYLNSLLPKRKSTRRTSASRRRRTTTRRRTTSSSRRRTTTRRRSTSTRRSSTRSVRTVVSASVKGRSSLNSLAKLLKYIAGTHHASVAVTGVSGKSKITSLSSAFKKVAGTHKASFKVSYSGTYKAKKSIDRLVSSIGKLKSKKYKSVSLKVKYSGTYKAKKSFDNLTKSIKSTSSKFKSIKSSSNSAGKSLRSLGSRVTSVHSRVSSLYKALKKEKFGNDIKKQAEEAVKSLEGKGNFAKIFSSMTKKFSKDLKNMSSDSKKEFKLMWSSIEKTSKSGENSTEHSLSSFSSKYKSGWKSLESGVSKTFDQFWTSMKNSSGRGINKVLDILNSGIKKIDSVIADFGGNKSAVSTVSSVHYASGTGAFNNPRRPITGPTPVILNDGSDSPETGNREGIYDKETGVLAVVNGTNVPFILDSRHEVFNASEMRELGVTRHYATGTGALKQLYEIAKKNWKNPSKTVKANFSRIVGLHGAVDSIAKGIQKRTESEALNWWSQLWKMVENKVNDDSDGSSAGLVKAMEKYGDGHRYVLGTHGPTTFDCSGLVQYALQHAYGISLPAPSGNQYAHTKHISRSEAKPGDLVFFGPAGGEHVGVYAGGDDIYSAMNEKDGIGMSKIHYFGTPLFSRVRGLKQTSDSKPSVKANTKLQKLIKNQTGQGFWKTIQKIADKYGDSISSIGKLAGSVKGRAIQMAKFLKGLDHKATKAGIAAILGSWEFESGGLNPKAINPNGGASGLGQWLGARLSNLKAYAHSHGKSWTDPGLQMEFAYKAEGSDSAIFRRILESSGSPGSLANDFSRLWERGGYDAQHVAGAKQIAGALGYANGGIITSPQFAMIGEGNGPETIVPWDVSKRSRAYTLMAKTLEHFKSQDAPNDGNSGGDTKLLAELIKLMTSIDKKLDIQTNEIRRLNEQPINVSGDFNMDGRKMAKYLRVYLREMDRKTVTRGRYNLSDR